MPEFSIIVPVYNVENYIRECMDSIVNQTFNDFEVLVTDDCGKDNSIKIVEEYAKKDKRIKIIHHKRNRGLAAARNTALKHASGKYIVCIDSDDWLDTNALHILKTEFERRGTESIWFNAIKYFDISGKFDDKPIYSVSEGYRIVTPENMASFSDFTWIKAYTRSSIQKAKLGWPEGLTFEDGEFYFKYFTLYPKSYLIEDCLVNYRIREGSIVREANKGNVKMQDIYTVVKHLRDFWIEHNVYEQYKVTMIKLIQNRVRMCRGLKYSDEYKKLSYEFIKDLKYPEDFSRLNPENINDVNPLVSVVLPLYKTEKYIPKCLKSVMEQSYKNLEILCIDDASPDNSAEIVEKFSYEDKRIKLITHKENKGLGGARNTGLKAARGKYIFFFDSDDWIEKDCIDLTVRKLIETGLNTVFYKADVYCEKNKNREPIWFKKYADFQEGYFTIGENDMCMLPHYTWNKGYDREFLIKNNLKWQEGVIYEDMEFFFKVFIKSPNTYMIDKPLYIYRRREDSIIGKCYNNLANANDLYTVTKHLKDYLVKNNLMKRYQNSFLQFVVNNMNNYREFGSTHAKLKPLMLKCLNDIDFPNAYTNAG